MVHRVALNDPSLTELDFSGCAVPLEDDEPRIVQKLVDSLATNTCLVRLSLCGSNLSGSGLARDLAAALASNSCLRALDIRRNHFGPAHLTSIIEALGKNTSLRELCCGSQHWMSMGLADDHESTSQALD